MCGVLGYMLGCGFTRRDNLAYCLSVFFYPHCVISRRYNLPVFIHAQNETATWNPSINRRTTIWDKNAHAIAGTMAFHRNLPPTTSIKASERGSANNRLLLHSERG